MFKPADSLLRAALPVFLGTALLLSGCGVVWRNNDVRLGVPYRAQATGSFDCGPASVLMWRLYDGLPEISQQTIADYMGSSACGASQDAIANAVNRYTNKRDAYWDFVGWNDHEDFFSRQITSIDNRVPVISIINGVHAGVINGGKWSHRTDGSYQWDYVYFHDPEIQANVYYAAGGWIEESCPAPSTCQQVISSGAVGAWAGNLSTYGDDLYVRGWDRERGPIVY